MCRPGAGCSHCRLKGAASASGCGHSSKMAANGGGAPAKKKKKRPRRDVYKDVKPYCGDPILDEGPDKVPTLYALSVHSVIRHKVPYAQCGIPTVLHKKLEVYRKYEEWMGPKIHKCSACGKFFTTMEKFDKHVCEMLTGGEDPLR